MDFTARSIKFSLKDIGSEVIDQLSRDIYTRPESIIREVVKNGYDAYLELDPEDFEDDQLERLILIRRDRDTRSVGRLFITDKGIGQTTDDAKANLQISISRKREEVENATGFRGLGSWALLGAGSKVVITSRRKGHNHVCRLTINTRQIYEHMGPQTTLHDILNNSAYVAFGDRPATAQDDPHFTIVEIECDGPLEKIRDYEINRLYPYTDPADTELRTLLLSACQIPFAAESLKYQELLGIYHQAGYYPTAVLLDGEKLERRLPATLSEFHSEPITLGNETAAIAWFVEHPKETRQVGGFIKKDTNILGPSFQLMKRNVPIGERGAFATKAQASLLDWYVGEIHILSRDILPDANGRDIRSGAAREGFILAVQAFYDRLIRRARTKSAKINLVDKLQKGVEAVQKLKDGGVSERDRIRLQSDIATAIDQIEEAKKKPGPKRAADKDKVNPLDDPEVKKTWSAARKVFQEGGWFDRLGATGKKPSRKKPSNNGSAKPNKSGTAKAGPAISIEDFQARLGRAIPRFRRLGLDEQLIAEVFRIIREVLEAKN